MNGEWDDGIDIWTEGVKMSLETWREWRLPAASGIAARSANYLTIHALWLCKAKPFRMVCLGWLVALHTCPSIPCTSFSDCYPFAFAFILLSDCLFEASSLCILKVPQSLRTPQPLIIGRIAFYNHVTSSTEAKLLLRSSFYWFGALYW